jgi:phage-related protein
MGIIKEGLKMESSVLRAGKEDLRNRVSAVVVKVNDGQTELDEKVTNRLDKQLKGLTSVVG